jgi:hypothetical protein
LRPAGSRDTAAEFSFNPNAKAVVDAPRKMPASTMMPSPET